LLVQRRVHALLLVLGAGEITSQLQEGGALVRVELRQLREGDIIVLEAGDLAREDDGPCEPADRNRKQDEGRGGSEDPVVDQPAGERARPPSTRSLSRGDALYSGTSSARWSTAC
jgi:hypothetical protein